MKAGVSEGKALEGLSVLVVDDEKNIRTTLTVCLEGLGCVATAVSSANEALLALEHRLFDVAFVDLRIGTESGLDLVPRLLTTTPNLAVVLITAYATIETAVEAIRRGASDYLAKPFTPAQIRHLLEKVVQQRALTLHVADLERRIGEASPDIDLFTSSPLMRGCVEMVGRAALAEAPVLFRGENGTGKGVLARALHTQSRRKLRPFVVTNCPTLTGDLLASELFGHAKGAFTGAVRDQPGRVEAAEGGTLFLDEIGEIPPALQAKLLRFLQDKDFERLGETRTRHADVRLVAATNRDLEADVRSGHFREDLLYRLNVVEVRVPSLRERREDILPLARRFLEFFARSSGRTPPRLSATAEETLLAYEWPGNVRELRNTMERALILWSTPVIEPAAFPERMLPATSPAPRVGGDFALEVIERAHIQAVVARLHKLEDAAAVLGIDGSTLWRKRKKYEE